jgi:hypothetical protein
MTSQGLYEGVVAELIRRRSDPPAGKIIGREPHFWCCFHPDGNGHAPHSPSLRINPAKEAWYCDPCGTGGSLRDLAERLGVNGYRPDDDGILATYDYHDASGRP